MTQRLKLTDKCISNYYKYFKEITEKVSKMGEKMENFIKRMEIQKLKFKNGNSRTKKCFS